ncbi:hypothetical protein [Nocardia sp. NPDC052566]|uniref:hypothetical protein n=1 Tax=Nocardia sp. NPDC052566 TaxID=3364330 RepID=UPI0037C7FE00
MTPMPTDTARELRFASAATVFARLAVAAGFLSAVADRFGWWGGTANVSWGNFDNFLVYLNKLAPYLSGPFVDVVGWVSTAAEIVLGLTLLFGIALRWSAWASTGLLLSFALSMFFFSGPEAPLSASVFSAAAASALLALAPAGAYVFSLDRVRATMSAHAVVPAGA